MSFLAPKAPKIAAPVPVPGPPTIDVAAQAAEQDLRMHRRRGRSGYVFGGAGMPAPVNSGTKTLTGQ